jgi:ATP synthase protein I
VPSIDSLVLRRAGLVTLLVGVVGTVIGGIVAGSEGVIAGVLGTVIVLVFFSVGQVVLGSVLKNNPQNAMMVAMTLYLVKIGVLLVLLLVLQDATFFAPKVFAAVIVACTLAWTFMEVWIFSRTQVLYVDPAGSPTSGGPESEAKK